jgi:phosphate/phosphite/phosphonate ABC transporter binding protein
MTTRRALILGTAAVMAGGRWLRPRQAEGSDWRGSFPELNIGVISSENEADRVARHQRFLAYMERTLRMKLRMHNATDYAGTIEGLKARKLEFARFGPASYAQAWLVTGGKVEPLAVQTDRDGFAGYHSVIVVGTDSAHRSVDDLKGKSLAFADPNSTSGYIAPRYFLKEAGFDPATLTIAEPPSAAASTAPVSSRARRRGRALPRLVRPRVRHHGRQLDAPARQGDGWAGCSGSWFPRRTAAGSASSPGRSWRRSAWHSSARSWPPWPRCRSARWGPRMSSRSGSSTSAYAAASMASAGSTR